jgi:hypothetical protein
LEGPPNCPCKFCSLLLVIKSKLRGACPKPPLLIIYQKDERVSVELLLSLLLLKRVTATNALAFRCQFLMFERVKVCEYLIMQIILSSKYQQWCQWVTSFLCSLEAKGNGCEGLFTFHGRENIFAEIRV